MKITLITAVILLTLPASICGQTAGERIEAALQDVRSLRTETASKLLRAGSQLTPSARQALADSLVAVAVAYEPGSPHQLERRANAAVAALGLAGREGLGAYFGAEAALKEVFHQSSDTGTRNAALWAVTQLSSPPRPETLEFFEDLAVSEDEFTASVAVQHLHQSLGQQGLAVLSRLYRAETVTAPNAVRILAWVARREGW